MSKKNKKQSKIMAEHLINTMDDEIVQYEKIVKELTERNEQLKEKIERQTKKIIMVEDLVKKVNRLLKATLTKEDEFCQLMEERIPGSTFEYAGGEMYHVTINGMRAPFMCGFSTIDEVPFDTLVEMVKKQFGVN